MFHDFIDDVCSRKSIEPFASLGENQFGGNLCRFQESLMTDPTNIKNLDLILLGINKMKTKGNINNEI